MTRADLIVFAKDFSVMIEFGYIKDEKILLFNAFLVYDSGLPIGQLSCHFQLNLFQTALRI